MLHPTVKSRLIFVRRLFLHALIEFFLKILGAQMEVNQYAKKLLDKHPDFTIALGNEI